MPLVTDDEGGGDLVTTEPTIVNAPITSIRTASLSNKPIAVDNRLTPRMNLITSAEGSSWTIDYYSQVLNVNSQLSGQQSTISATNQQYTKINNLVVKVTSPLSSSQDDETKAITVTGTAIVPSFMLPNDNDMFTADIGGGTRAIFSITNTVKLSMFEQAAYEVTYTLNSQEENKFLDLEAKVVKEDFYHDNFIALGKNPIVASSKHSILLELGQTYNTLLKQYFKKFYSSEFKTILLPGQTQSIYDHFLVDFLLSQFNTWDTNEIRYVNKLNVDDDTVMSCDSVWTALKNKDVSYLNTSFKRFGLVSTVTFSNIPVAHGIRYTGVRRAIYPIDPVLNVDGTLHNNTKLVNIESLIEATAQPGELNEMAKAINLRMFPKTVKPLTVPIKLVTEDDYYVFTESFYNKTNLMSALESIVYDYLENKSIDSEQLINTAKLYSKWGLLEQFYYCPILMLLMKSIINGDVNA